MAKVALPAILDAVCDQRGDRWIRYGTRERAIWFALADLISNASNVFCRLSSVGATCLTSSAQNQLKREVEAYRDFRPALVATRPGWLEGFYLFGDGTLARPRSDAREVIVTFAPNWKFTSSGSLAEWQAAVAPFVENQPLPFFALALALTGPLLRFVPSGYMNPQAEIVGKGETGKSSVAALAASIWAGNPESECGGGELWDMTLNTLDELKIANRDGFLFLDEGNLQGASQKDQREFAQKAVFKLATTGGKRRMGDAVQSEHAHLALLSTTNTALTDLLNGSTEARDAAQSRMITIRIAPDTPLGVFAFIPPGHLSARQTSEAARAAADQFWGTAGRAFVERLVKNFERDEARLRRVIARSLATYIRQDRAPRGSARVQKTFALVTVAAALAQEWRILPREWGSPMHMVQQVACATASIDAADEAEPLAAIRAYVEHNRARLIRIDDLRHPLTRAEFEIAFGFLREGCGGEELLVPAARFQAAFPDFKVLMRALRDSGQTQTEGGHKSKLTIKTPRTISHAGRVYCIRLQLHEINE